MNQTKPRSDRRRQEADNERKPYEDRYWHSADGLSLHYRDYRGPADGGATPLVCIPGLTRNARDFAGLAESVAPQRRVLCVDLRGRGLSEYAREPESYNVPQYVADIAALLDEAELDRAVFVGTSLGGLVTMLTAARDADRIAGAVLNDIGPVIEAAGLDRVREYVGQGRSFPTWMHAARALEETQRECFPDWKVEDWLAHAKRLMVWGGNDRICYDYDMRIANAFARPGGAGAKEESENGADAAPDAPDLWPAFDALAGRPVLLLRGAHSDILSPATARAMQARHGDLDLVTVATCGHAPTLDEPESRAAIARLLDRVD